MRVRSALVLTLILLVAPACGGGDDEEASTQLTPTSNDVAEIPDEVTGVIIDIESSGLNKVESFVVKDGDETYEIFTADDVDYGFALGHLNEHLTTADPVRVELEERDGKAVALSINDV